MKRSSQNSTLGFLLGICLLRESGQMQRHPWGTSALWGGPVPHASVNVGQSDTLPQYAPSLAESPSCLRTGLIICRHALARHA
jgi:hypothetical protein